MHDLLKILYVLVSMDCAISGAFRLHAGNAKISATVLKQAEDMGQMIQEHAKTVDLEAKRLIKEVTDVVTKYRSAVESADTLEAWSAKASRWGDLDHLKESLASSVSDHRANTEPALVAERLLEMVKVYNAELYRITPFDTVDGLSHWVGQTVNSCIQNISEHYAKRQAMTIDGHVSSHLEETDIAWECESCIKRYDIKRRIPSWLKRVGKGSNDGESLVREIDGIVAMCRIRLDEMLAASAGATLTKGERSKEDPECAQYQYAKLHGNLEELLQYNTGPGKDHTVQDITSALDAHHRNVDEALDEYQKCSKTATLPAANRMLVEQIHQHVQEVVSRETSGSYENNVKECLEREGVACRPDSAMEEFVSKVNESEARFIKAINIDTILKSIKVLDRAAVSYANVARLPRGIERFAGEIDSMVVAGVSRAKTPDPAAWLIQRITDMAADYKHRSKSDPNSLSVSISKEVMWHLAPDRTMPPISRLWAKADGPHGYYLNEFDANDPLLPLAKSILDIVDRFCSKGKSPHDMMQMAMNVADAIHGYRARQNSQEPTR